MIYKLKVTIRSGRYYEEKVERILEVAGSSTLVRLCEDILSSVGFDDDHMFEFTIKGVAYEGSLYGDLPFGDSSKEVKRKLYTFNLKKGEKFSMLYDFGDCWNFDIKVMDVMDAEGGKTKLISSRGNVEQYPDYDDEFYDYEDAEDSEELYGDDEDLWFDDNGDPTMMELYKDYDYHISDKLYEAAFKYKKLKPWSKFWSNEPFAVRFSDGATGYICIMGRDGSHCALGIYVGDEAFEGYRDLSFTEPPKRFYEEHERVFRQDCIQMIFDTKDYLNDAELSDVYDYTDRKGIKLSGKNAFPHFQRFRPNHVPWILDSKDENYILEAVHAVEWLLGILGKDRPLDVGIFEILPGTDRIKLIEKKNGNYTFENYINVSSKIKKDYPAADKINQIALKRLSGIKSKGCIQSKVIYMTEPVMDEGRAPYFPVMLFSVQTGSRSLIIPPELVKDYDKEYDQIVNFFIDKLVDFKIKPTEIQVSDERTYSLLESFAKKADIKLKMVSELKELEAAAEEMAEPGFHGEDNMEQAYNDFVEIVSMIAQMPDSKIKKLDKFMIAQIKDMMDADILPDDIVRELRKKKSFR
ncbi:MAG: hypothetical protein IJ065_07820 [Eubacterium sp.]|nr:hypothetical protein [Eubacterium sp.]